MTNTINGKTILSTPFTVEDIQALHAGDVIYVNGDIVTGRDDVHIRVVKEGMELPADLSGKVLMHAGPIISGSAETGYEIVSIGPTTSMRMEKLEHDFIVKTGVRLIIGKGGMGERTAAACRGFGAVHCVLPAGNAVVGAACVEEITGVEWLDLGMPEAMWKLNAEKFGPLIVSIDSYGNNLIENNKVDFNTKKEQALNNLKGKLSYME